MKTNKNYYVSAETKKVKINNVVIAYWLEPADEGQDYIVPVYKFNGQCLDENGKQLDTPFTDVIEALK